MALVDFGHFLLKARRGQSHHLKSAADRVPATGQERYFQSSESPASHRRTTPLLLLNVNFDPIHMVRMQIDRQQVRGLGIYRLI